jgi:hypothetical protein
MGAANKERVAEMEKRDGFNLPHAFVHFKDAAAAARVLKPAMRLLGLQLPRYKSRVFARDANDMDTLMLGNVSAKLTPMQLRSELNRILVSKGVPLEGRVNHVQPRVVKLRKQAAAELRLQMAMLAQLEKPDDTREIVRDRRHAHEYLLNAIQKELKPHAWVIRFGSHTAAMQGHSLLTDSLIDGQRMAPYWPRVSDVKTGKTVFQYNKAHRFENKSSTSSAAAEL